jgi:hypothetical protein
MSGLQQYEGVLIFHTYPCLHKEQNSEIFGVADMATTSFRNELHLPGQLCCPSSEDLFFKNIHN